MRIFLKLHLRVGFFINCVVIIALLLSLPASACAAQAPSAAQSPPPQWLNELFRNPELLSEFGQLMEALQRDVKFPPARTHSRLLPLLPDATMSYAAFSNYGDAAHQALQVFRRHLQQSAALRDWWRHGDMALTGPKIENWVERLDEVSHYLGDEIVFSGGMASPAPSLLIVAEIRKPGFKTALQQELKELAGKSKPGVRVLDLQELAAMPDKPAPQELLVLVRPDYVVAAMDIPTLRSFNTRLDRGGREFISTPFGQRMAQAYVHGVTMLAALDVQTILKQAPTNDQSFATLQRTGFADLKYLVWEHTNIAGQDVSQSELSFTGPRRGMAAWMGSPTTLGSLDFVSPNAILAASVVLFSPAQMFEDVRQIATASNPNAFAGLAKMEQALNLSLQEDLLRLLSGEITVELESAPASTPVWRLILGVNDPQRMRQTLSTMLAAMQVRSQQFDRAGVTYHTLLVPAGKTVAEVAYTFVGGYLVIASSPQAATDAVRLHRTGESLGKSKRLLDSLPPGHPSGISALVFQDPVAMNALRLRQLAPELAGSLEPLSGANKPAVMCAYAEQTAIRGASTSAAIDAGVVLITAAIAIPNLLRARIAANEASALGTLRMLNVAQQTYAANYPYKGFAPDLATLGPGPGGSAAQSPKHAGLIPGPLGDPDCTAGAWCGKSGFRFTLAGVCANQRCKDFVAVGTPLNAGTGARSFCSTSDGVIRSKPGPALAAPLSASECRSWAPLK